MARKAITKKARFEVFKRDSFTCQYCGAKAPDVVLNVDHIKPVAGGGDNDITNLITSCFPCNSGKSDRAIDDNSIVSKQRQQLAEITERREQLKLMLKWRESIKQDQDMELDYAESYWNEKVETFHLNDSGRKILKKLIKDSGLQPVLNAIDLASEKYLVFKDGEATKESVELCFNKVGGILFLKSQPEDIRRVYYAKGILTNRGIYVNQSVYMDICSQFIQQYDPNELITFAKEARTWTGFRRTVEDILYGKG